MKLLLDEMIPRPLGRDLVAHNVSSIEQAGWKGLKNGKLLALAEQEFEAFITMDTKLPFQQKLEVFDLGFVIIHAINNKIETLRPIVPEILQTLNHLRPGQVVHVPS